MLQMFGSSRLHHEVEKQREELLELFKVPSQGFGRRLFYIVRIGSCAAIN